MSGEWARKWLMEGNMGKCEMKHLKIPRSHSWQCLEKTWSVLVLSGALGSSLAGTRAEQGKKKTYFYKCSAMMFWSLILALCATFHIHFWLNNWANLYTDTERGNSPLVRGYVQTPMCHLSAWHHLFCHWWLMLAYFTLRLGAEDRNVHTAQLSCRDLFSLRNL